MRTRITLLGLVLLIASGTNCPIDLLPNPRLAGLPNPTTWTTQPTTTGPSQKPSIAVLSNVDAQGLRDIVVGYQGTSSTFAAVAAMFRSTGTTFETTTLAYGPELSGIDAVAAGNLADDGGPLEVVAGCRNGLYYLHCSGDAHNSSHWTISMIDGSGGMEAWKDVAIRDLDGDMKPDVVALNWRQGIVRWFRVPPGATTGTGWEHFDIAQGREHARSLAVADLDGDGDLDLVSAAAGTACTHRIMWHENPLPGVRGADFYQDGVWPGHLIGGLANPSRVALGDLDGDGRIDVAVGNGIGENDGSPEKKCFTDHSPQSGPIVAWYRQPEDLKNAVNWPGFILAKFNEIPGSSVFVSDVLIVNLDPPDPTNPPPKVIEPRNEVVASLSIHRDTPGNPAEGVTSAALSRRSIVRWFAPYDDATRAWLESNVADLSSEVWRMDVGDMNDDNKPDLVVPLIDLIPTQDRVNWLQNPLPNGSTP